MPGHFKAYFNRGFAYDKLGLYDQAIKDYSYALEIDPNNVYAYYNRGYLFYISPPPPEIMQTQPEADATLRVTFPTLYEGNPSGCPYLPLPYPLPL